MTRDELEQAAHEFLDGLERDFAAIEANGTGGGDATDLDEIFDEIFADEAPTRLSLRPPALPGIAGLADTIMARTATTPELRARVLEAADEFERLTGGQPDL